MRPLLLDVSGVQVFVEYGIELHFLYCIFLDYPIHVQNKLLIFLLYFYSLCFQNFKTMLKFLLDAPHIFMSLIKMAFF